MQDDKIVELYWQRSEAAIRHTDRKYGHYLTKLSYNILADWEDSKESVNDTYLHAWKSIPPQRPNVLLTYLCKITRHVSIDILRKRNSAKRRPSEYVRSLSELDDCVSAGNRTEQEVDLRLLAKAVQDYLKTLPEEMRDIFIGRYYFSDSIREVSKYHGMSEAKTKSMLYRIRMGLKKYLEQERFVAVSSLLAADAGNVIQNHAAAYTTVPIEQYKGVYTEVPFAEVSVLAESMGKSVDGARGWHYISGHSDRQYLIRNDGQEFSLWKFQCFDSGEYPYEDVLKLVYQIHSADEITEIEVMPAQMDRSDGGIKIQNEIGTHKITDKAAIETVYEAISGMTCYGSGRWDRINYGDAEVTSDGESESDHEAVKLGRYLSITTNYGNVIDGLKYTAVSDMFYEFSGIAYEPLTQEQAVGVWEMIGIRKSGEEKEEGFDENPDHGETDYLRQENNEPGAAEKVFLSQATNTDAGPEYVTELQNKVSDAMRNHELPFVVASAVYENPYKLHVVVTSDAEEDLQKLWDLDSAGGVLEVEYAPGYGIHLY